jgi:hypothetical protein
MQKAQESSGQSTPNVRMVALLASLLKMLTFAQPDIQLEWILRTHCISTSCTGYIDIIGRLNVFYSPVSVSRL